MPKKRIKIHTSFDTQHEEEISYTASISPVQRLKETVEMIRKVYGTPPNIKRITIIRRG
jgi:hypothetical protein